MIWLKIHDKTEHKRGTHERKTTIYSCFEPHVLEMKKKKQSNKLYEISRVVLDLCIREHACVDCQHQENKEKADEVLVHVNVNPLQQV